MSETIAPSGTVYITCPGCYAKIVIEQPLRLEVEDAVFVRPEDHQRELESVKADEGMALAEASRRFAELADAADKVMDMFERCDHPPPECAVCKLRRLMVKS